MGQATHVRKRLIVLGALAIVNGIGSVLAAVYLHPAFIAIAIGIPAACGVGMLLIRCPRCGQRVLKRQYHAFGVTWTYWGGFWIPDRCEKCGLDFRDAKPGTRSVGSAGNAGPIERQSGKSSTGGG
jgi:uncharacterized C2H2 Zn-finger protein